MFKLSYSLNSADLLPIEEICSSLLKFGYSGVELSFQYHQFDPFSVGIKTGFNFGPFKNRLGMHRDGRQLIPIPKAIGVCHFINDLEWDEIRYAVEVLEKQFSDCSVA